MLKAWNWRSHHVRPRTRSETTQPCELDTNTSTSRAAAWGRLQACPRRPAGRWRSSITVLSHHLTMVILSEHSSEAWYTKNPGRTLSGFFLILSWKNWQQIPERWELSSPPHNVVIKSLDNDGFLGQLCRDFKVSRIYPKSRALTHSLTL